MDWGRGQAAADVTGGVQKRSGAPAAPDGVSQLAAGSDGGVRGVCVGACQPGATRAVCAAGPAVATGAQATSAGAAADEGPGRPQNPVRRDSSMKTINVGVMGLLITLLSVGPVGAWSHSGAFGSASGGGGSWSAS